MSNTRSMIRTGVLFLLTAVVGGALILGCNKTKTAYRNPDDEDKLGGTGIDSQDVRTVCELMTRDILNTPEIARATTTPRIALLPVENRTRFRIDSDIFTQKMRTQLIQLANGKVRFLAREDLKAIMDERADKRAGTLEGATQKNLKGADYFLTGKISGISKSAGEGRSDYTVYTFRLADTESSEIVWEKDYDVKKEGSYGTVYR